MRLDYSPLDSTPRPSARRSFLIAALVLVSVGAVMSREGAAARHAATVAAPDAGAEPEAGTGFEVPGAAEAPPAPEAEPWITVTVHSGQTLSTLFDAEGLPAQDWVRILDLGGDARRLLKLRAGDRLQLRKGPEGLAELIYPLDELRSLQVIRSDTGFEAITLAAEIERRPTYTSGVITSSLFEAGQEAGLSSRLIMELADVFGYDIDFALDIRVNDRFTVIYEDLYKDGERLREGHILAAEFQNQGTLLRAVRYTDPKGNANYYAPEGQSLRRAFIRTPLDVFRITSGFSYARRHPILNRIRAHRGVDYAAARGTPIKATGDGRVSYMGYKGGYGKVITLRHGASYETLYAHLSRFRPGLGYGARVKQGQIIGYVGDTGLATAPHLHYEFRINGVHKNPLKVVLPRAESLPRQYLEHFRASTQPLLAQLDTLNRTRVALAN